MKTKIILFITLFPTLLFGQGTEENWPEINYSSDANYFQKKAAFYEWFNNVSDDSLLMDTINKTPYYKKFRRFEAHLLL